MRVSNAGYHNNERVEIIAHLNIPSLQEDTEDEREEEKKKEEEGEEEQKKEEGRSKGYIDNVSVKIQTVPKYLLSVALSVPQTYTHV